MTVNALNQPRREQSPILLAGWCTIVGAVLTFLLGIPLASFQNQTPLPVWIPALNAISHLLFLVGVIGLARTGAAGRSLLATGGLALTLFGLVVVTVAEFISMVNMETAILFFSSATLLMMVGLILLGIAVLRARRWTSWARFMPLTCGLFVLLVMLPSFALPGLASNYAIGFWGVCWLFLGVALITTTTQEAG